MVAIGTNVPGRTHPTLVKEAKGFSVVVAVVAVVAAFFIGADYLRHWSTFAHKKGASCWFFVASCFQQARKGAWPGRQKHPLKPSRWRASVRMGRGWEDPKESFLRKTEKKL
jgi:hypothetical protein